MPSRTGGGGGGGGGVEGEIVDSCSCSFSSVTGALAANCDRVNEPTTTLKITFGILMLIIDVGDTGTFSFSSLQAYWMNRSSEIIHEYAITKDATLIFPSRIDCAENVFTCSRPC